MELRRGTMNRFPQLPVHASNAEESDQATTVAKTLLRWPLRPRRSLHQAVCCWWYPSEPPLVVFFAISLAKAYSIVLRGSQIQ